jgi:nitroreductase
MTTGISTDARAVLRALRRTRQIRDFRPDPVPQELLDELLQVGRWSGSATNSQPWTFIVIRDAGTRAKLAELAPNARHVAKAPLVLAIAMSGEHPDWEAYDEGRVAERILVAATALGLGAGIGWVNEARRAAVAELLGVPEPGYVRTMISVGYPTTEASAPKSAPGRARKPLAELVRHERFG